MLVDIIFVNINQNIDDFPVGIEARECLTILANIAEY